MMTTTLVSMIGHQPLPILLAIRYLQPDQVLFLYSATGDVVQRKRNLTELLAPGCREYQVPPVDPWDIRSIPTTLPEIIRRRRLDETTLVFDLTGGTKVMAIGLTQVAKQYQQATLIYIDSESTSSTLYQYRFVDGDRLERDEGTQLPDLLTLDMFFHAYQGRFDTHQNLQHRRMSAVSVLRRMLPALLPAYVMLRSCAQFGQLRRRRSTS